MYKRQLYYLFKRKTYMGVNAVSYTHLLSMKQPSKSIVVRSLKLKFIFYKILKLVDIYIILVNRSDKI